jgi:hypothetical protein
MMYGQMRKTNIGCGGEFVQNGLVWQQARNHFKMVTLWQHNLMSTSPIEEIMQTIERYYGAWHVSC